MIIGKVIGNVVATIKHPAYVGKKVLIIQPLSLSLKNQKTSFLAVDSVRAGVDDIVLVEREGNAAKQILGDAPFHSVIVGIIDKISLE